MAQLKLPHTPQELTITNITSYAGWGSASSTDFTIDPGLWILDNFGTKLNCTYL